MQRLLLLLLIFTACRVQAQVDRTTLFGMGRASVLDTYLTPYDHKGPSLSLTMLTERPAHWGGGAVTTMGRYALQGALATVSTSGARYYDGDLTLAGGWHRNWHLLDGQLRLAAGGLIELTGGGTYSEVGGNNPAQGRLAAGVCGSGIAAYDVRIKGHLWQLRAQLDVPLIGAAFAPQYGQSYYQLFHLGHYDRNVRLTHPFDAPSLRLLTTLSLPVRHSRLVLGYGGDVRQHSLNGLKRHAWYNQFLVGFSRKLTLVR